MSPAVLFAILLIAALLPFFIYYFRSMQPRAGTLEWIPMQTRRPLRFQAKRHPMERKDVWILLLLVAVQVCTGFFRLGSMSAPQTFARITPGEPVVLELAEQAELGYIRYYPGLNTGWYQVAVSLTGTDWKTVGTLEQGTADVFKWLDCDFEGTPVRARYLRLTAVTGYEWLECGELVLFDTMGQPLAGTDLTMTDAVRPLFDEQDTVPEYPTWYDMTYYDEVYHGRTAKEHLENIYPYEITHPPLGKLIIGVGVTLFGMTPFGWRVMGTLCGVLMLPFLYMFLKNLFGKTAVAAIGTALFISNFMTLTQTRIGTIDSYTVFFILTAYFFFYRYLTAEGFRKSILPLFLSGLCFGLGVSAKWQVVYAGAGLALLWLLHMIFRFRSWEYGRGKPNFIRFFAATAALSVLFFVVVPGILYLAVYIPYVTPRGELTLPALWKAMTENQVFMLTYHQGVTEAHPYQSAWYQWIVDARPILYYRDDHLWGEGHRVLFAAFDNPVVSWSGLLCIVVTGYRAFQRASGKALFILVGYLAQLVPWMFISRPTFAYHYFPATIFLVLGICFVLNDLISRKPKGWQWPVYGLPSAAAAVYAMFYPALIGLQVPHWYNELFLLWLPSWPL